MHGILLLIHILSATIWTGGHIILATTVLPRALRNKSPDILLNFESSYEKIGLPAFLIQVFTGIALAYHIAPDITLWTHFENPVSRLILAKGILVGLTLAFAVHAKTRVLPGLSKNTLHLMAWHIIPVTIISILFVAVGVSFRTGWAY